MRAAPLVLAAVALLPLACRREPAPPPAPAPLETQEVEAAPDSALSTANDTVEHRRTSGFAGVLPSNFPSDLPVYEPSSLVDFGRGTDGDYALFQTPDEPAKVRARYTALLGTRGWAANGNVFVHGSRRVRLGFENARPGTRLRVTY